MRTSCVPAGNVSSKGPSGSLTMSHVSDAEPPSASKKLSPVVRISTSISSQLLSAVPSPSMRSTTASEM